MIKQRVFVNDREVRRVHVSVLYLSRSSVISHLLLLWPGDGSALVHHKNHQSSLRVLGFR